MKFFSDQVFRLLDAVKSYILSDSAPRPRKREFNEYQWCDDSDDETDIEIEPPFKRSRLHEPIQEDPIKRFSSIRDKRIFGSLSGLPSRYPHFSRFAENNKNRKQQELSVSAATPRIGVWKDMDNKENFSKITDNYKHNENEEVKFLGSSIEIPVMTSSSQNIDSAFKFSPTTKFSPKITSTVSRDINKEWKWKSLNSQKCFELKRTPLKARRLPLIGKYTNPNKVKFPHLQTAMQSVRLSEKSKYGKLLKQYSSSSQQCYISGFKKSDLLCTATKSKPALIISHLSSEYTLEKKKFFKEQEKNGTLFPIETTSPLRPSTKEIPLIDLEAEEDKKTTEDDDEIFITKVLKSPRKYPINRLEEKLLKCEYYLGENLLYDKEEEKEKSKSFQDDIRKIEEESERRKKSYPPPSVDNLSASLSKLSTRYPFEVIEVTDEEDGKLTELTKDMKIIIHRSFKGGPSNQVLAEKFNIQITRKDICTLAGLNWLNDEVINFYMNMIVERSQKEKTFPRVYAYNTFFYSKIVKNGYAPVRRWTKKIDIFTHDILLIPVHLGMHWCLATVDFRSKAIRYYDSMLGDNYKCLEELRKYLNSEHQDKKSTPYQVELSAINVKDIPQQMNGSDCGMFSCKFAEYISRNAPITFTQENMPYFRHRMVYEIVSQKLMAEKVRPYT